MLMRRLGKAGPKVSALGLGCMSMSAFYEVDRDRDEALHNLREAYGKGINFFDTADMYGDGENEVLLGEAFAKVLADERDSIVIATKCGFVPDPDEGYVLDCSATHIKAACEASLKRLGVEYIDLFYLHRLDPKVTLESLGALVELIQAGKIKGIGLSEVDVDTMQQVHDFLKSQGLDDRFWAVQTEYNLLSRGPELHGVFAKCEELGVAFVPYSPLSRSLLTGKVDASTGFADGDFRGFLPRFQGDNFKANLEIVEALKTVAAEKSCTLPQLALAWILAKGEFIVPIPGSRKLDHIISNAKAVEVALSADDVTRIESMILSLGGAKGPRYTADMVAAQNIQEGGAKK